MICLNIYRNATGEIVGFGCTGHAEYGESGSDIICAAVSMLVINTINSIEKLTGDKFRASNDEDGNIQFSFINSASKESLLLIDAMILGVKTCQKKYSDQFVKVII